MIIYLAGPYSAAESEQVQRNISAAREVALALWEAGYTVITPHLNTAGFEQDCSCTWDRYMSGYLEILARCDAIVMLPEWKNSKGATQEFRYACSVGIPVLAPQELLDADITHLTYVESNSPLQARGFIEVIMKMYRTHLSKNRDYSPANILGTGEIGLVTRIWDKVARLLNLVGFRLTISDSSFTAPKTPKHESIDDTLEDLAVYAVIAQLHRQGKWGK